MKDKIRTFVSKNAVLLVLALAALSIPLASYLHEFFKPKAVASSEHKPWVVYDVSETLQLLAVPLSYELNGQKVDKNKVRSEAIEVRRPVPQVYGMVFIVPGETGLHDPGKISSGLPGRYWDENLVGVFMESWSKADYERNPAAARDMRQGWELMYGDRLKRGELPFNLHGLSCYRPGGGKDNTDTYSSCLGEIDSGRWVSIWIDDFSPQKGALSKVRVHYFSKTYGGLTIRWEVHVKHAAKWKEIDAKLWRLLDERNLAVNP